MCLLKVGGWVSLRDIKFNRLHKKSVFFFTVILPTSCLAPIYLLHYDKNVLTNAIN